MILRLLLSLALLFQGPSIPAGSIGKAPTVVGHTFTLVQKKNSSGNCNGVSPCTLGSLATIGAGHLLIVGVSSYNTTTSTTLTAVTGGSNTWVLNPGTAPCRNSTANTSFAYVLSAAGGGTSVVVTWSNTATGQDIFFREYSYTPNDGLAALDSATSTATNSANPFPGATPSITSTSDVVMQLAAVNSNNLTAIDSGYGNAEFDGIAGNAADLLNTTATATPNWTSSGNNNGCASALSIK